MLDGEKLPDVSPYHEHGQIAVRIGSQLDAWVAPRRTLVIIAAGYWIHVFRPRPEAPGGRVAETPVLVLHPMKRRVWSYRADGTVEEREARGALALPPFDDLTLGWEKIYRGI